MHVYINIERPIYYLMDELFQYTGIREPNAYLNFVLDEFLVYSWGEHHRSILKYEGSLKEYLDNLKIPSLIRDYMIVNFQEHCYASLRILPYHWIFTYDGYFEKDSVGIYWCFEPYRNARYCAGARDRPPTLQHVG